MGPLQNSSYREAPAVFETARSELAERVDHWGYLESAAEYARVLRSCDVVLSTALHEFFGISVVPKRLERRRMAGCQ